MCLQTKLKWIPGSARTTQQPCPDIEALSSHVHLQELVYIQFQVKCILYYYDVISCQT